MCETTTANQNALAALASWLIQVTNDPTAHEVRIWVQRLHRRQLRHAPRRLRRWRQPRHPYAPHLLAGAWGVLALRAACDELAQSPGLKGLWADADLPWETQIGNRLQLLDAPTTA